MLTPEKIAANEMIHETARLLGVAEFKRDKFRDALMRIRDARTVVVARQIADDALRGADAVGEAMDRFHSKLSDIGK